MPKRFLSIFMVLTIASALLLSACGGGQVQATPTQPVAPTPVVEDTSATTATTTSEPEAEATTTPTDNIPAAVLEAVKNAEYPSDLAQNGFLRLKDGIYKQKIDANSATETTASLGEVIAFGELKDRTKAALVDLIVSGGGSGTFHNLAVVANPEERPLVKAITQLGDRVIVKDIQIKDGLIVVEMVTHGPDDAQCCPTLPVTVVFDLQGDKLVVVNGADSGANTFASTLVGPAWKLVEFQSMDDTKKVPPDPASYSAQFNLDGTVNVVADCNQGGGTYLAADPSLAIEITSMTRAACPPESLADQFVEWLNQSASYMIKDGFLFIALKIDSGIMKFSQ